MPSPHRRAVGLFAAVAAVTTAVALGGMATADTSSPGGRAASPPVGPLPARLAPTWVQHPELVAGSAAYEQLTQSPPAAPVERPNVVLITTDDQTIADLRWMPKTRALIGAAGVTFHDSISPHPLCCPARAQMLTGQYAQNNGVRSNRPPFGGYYALDHTNTLPVWLSRAGYSTAFLGKYLNLYGTRDATEVPDGWQHWYGAVRHTYDFTDVTLNQDGALVRYPGVYQTDLYATLTERLVPRLVAADRPFFLWQSHVAPHAACSVAMQRSGERCWGAPTPPERYAGVFDSVRPPQLADPSFGEADVSDKPGRVRRRPTVDHRLEQVFTSIFHRRLESLAAVDDTVARTLGALQDAGVLDDTIVIFTSDNGFLLGEHRLSGKILGYEPALRVPLLIRGPGIPAGVHRDQTVATVDLAPTIVSATGATPGLVMDGRNLLRVAADNARGWNTVLVQGGPRSLRRHGPWLYRGVRTDRYTFLRYPRSNEVELYDRRRDPAQLENVARDPRYADVRADLTRRLLTLRQCSGADCRQRFGRVAAPIQ